MADDQLYRLPGSRLARRRIISWAYAGVLVSLVLACTAGTQSLYYFHGLTFTSSPLWILPDTLALACVTTALLVFVFWFLALVYNVGRIPIATWGIPLLSITLAVLTWGPVYAPYGLLQAYRWSDQGRLPRTVQPAMEQATTVSLVYGSLLLVWLFLTTTDALKRAPKTGATHGSAHWATLAEIRQSGLLPDTPGGVVLGSIHGQPLRCIDDRHTLVFAPPGTGKSTTLGIPTLFTYRGSMLVFDTKGELYETTSAFRSKELRQNICRMDFTASNKLYAGYNPLLQIPAGKAAVPASQAIAKTVIATSAGDEFWANSARELLVAVILHLLYTHPAPTLTACRQFLRSGDLDAVLVQMLLTHHDPTSPWVSRDALPTATHPEVSGTAHSFLHMAHRQRSGIVGHVLSSLTEFGDERLAANTTNTDILPTDLMDRDQPTTLYITLPAGDISRLNRVLRLIVTQWLGDILMRPVGSGSERPYKHPVLFLLDEFPILGKLDYLNQAAPLLRGYGVLLYLIVQSQTQLKQIYGVHQTLSEICSTHVSLGASDVATAREISEKLGPVTIDTERSSTATRGSRTTISDGQHGRPLLAPGEVTSLPDNKSIVMPLASPPILADRTPYFKDPLYQRPAAMGELEVSQLKRFDHTTPWRKPTGIKPTAEQMRQYLEELRS